MITTTIGLQARLASTRLNRKSIYEIEDKTLVNHLLDRIYQAIYWLKKRPNRDFFSFNVCLLTPEIEKEFWDDFTTKYNMNNRTTLDNISGDMNNVFSRYNKMYNKYMPNYIMRLTSDCPFIPSQLISKAINISSQHRLDYISNVDEVLRTMPDGYDVEVISEKAFEWLIQNIPESKRYHYDLEHVTTYLRENFQTWMRGAVITGNIDQSRLKYSIDTIEEFEAVKDRYRSKITKDQLATEKGFGVYEF